jgi:hypothetical protein
VEITRLQEPTVFPADLSDLGPFKAARIASTLRLLRVRWVGDLQNLADKE